MERDVELSVGDVLQIGNHLLTVLDIDGEDITFRLDEDVAEQQHDPSLPSIRPR